MIRTTIRVGCIGALMCTVMYLQGCLATASDIQDVADSLKAVADGVQSTQAGQMSQDQLSEVFATSVADIGSKAEELKERGAGIVSTLGGAIAGDPMGALITLLIGGGGIVAGAAKHTNNQRDKKRAARGEPT